MAYRPLSRYSYDKSVYQISFKYLHPVRRKQTETGWTDRQTAAKQYALPSSKGCIKIVQALLEFYLSPYYM
jgi:hypothetical protein